jgi:hypothetical protein
MKTGNNIIETLPGHLASQVFEERHDVVGIDRVILVMEIQEFISIKPSVAMG